MSTQARYERKEINPGSTADFADDMRWRTTQTGPEFERRMLHPDQHEFSQALSRPATEQVQHTIDAQDIVPKVPVREK